MGGEGDAVALFRWLDRLFWLLWLGLPVMVWSTLWGADGGALPALFDEADAACAVLVPRLGSMSDGGRLLWGTAIVVEYVVLATVMALAHRMIHRFAQGRILVDETLASLRRVALLIVAYPFYDAVSRNALAFGLSRTGDLRTFLPDPGLDVTVLGVGLLLLTLAVALRHAVELQREAELTI